MNRKTKSLILAIAASLAWSGEARAQNQKMCVPPGVVTAGIADGAWEGVRGQVFSTGTATPGVVTKALWDDSGNALHILFEVASTALSRDLYVGFKRTLHATDAPYIIKFHVDSTSAGGITECTQINASCSGNYVRLHKGGGAANPGDCSGTSFGVVDINDTGSWITDVHYEVGADGVWKVMATIPLEDTAQGDGWVTSSIDKSSPPSIWYQVSQALTTQDSAIAEWLYPATSKICYADGIPPKLVRANDPWADFSLLPTQDSPCEGIWIDGSRIGTLQTDGSLWYEIEGNDVENQLTARAQNDSAVDIQIGQLEASFFLYNWGSQPMAPTAQGLIPGQSPPRKNTASISAGQSGDIILPWTLSSTERCEFGIPKLGQSCAEAPKYSEFQCMMVELKSTFGIPLSSSQRIAFRNMRMVPASTFRDEAEISIKGLQALAEKTGRDVYLVVGTRNMARDPKQFTPAVAIAQRARIMLRRIDVAKQQAPGPTPLLDARRAQYAAFSNLAETADYDDIVQLSKRKDPAVLANLLPTFQVFAFHESDHRLETDDQSIPIAKPQSSFGYFAYHEGPMYAWAWALDGAEQVGPNIFRIRIPNDGVAPVRVRLQAVESPDEPRVASNPSWPLSSPDDQQQCVNRPCPPCQGCCCKKAQVSALEEGASRGGLALITGLLAWLVFRRRKRPAAEKGTVLTF